MPNYQLGKIYNIMNDINDILYVGSTAQPYLCSRWSSHRVNSKDATRTSGIYNAMRTIGVDHFRIVLHHVFPCNSKDELVAEEYRTLDALITAGKSVYNNVIGGKADDTTKAKLAAAQKGKKATDATKAKLAAAQKGKKATDSTKAKMSIAQKGKKVTDVTKAKIAAAQKGNLNNQFSFGCIGLYTVKGNRTWTFQWCDNEIRRKKSFSCDKYGDYGAHWRAEQVRRQIYPEWGNEEDCTCDDFGEIEWEV